MALHICQPGDRTKILCSNGPSVQVAALNYSEVSRANLMNNDFCELCRDEYVEIEAERNRIGYYR